jgi:RNA polymerase sigma factor (sigma-70 family)
VSSTTTELQHWIELLQAGDDRARHALIGRACERLRLLTRRMLRSFPVVRSNEQTDDVCHSAVLRLYRCLAEVRPESLRHFYALAGQQIRRELLDLAKQAGRLGGRCTTMPGDSAELDRPCDNDSPGDLADWAEFHAQIESLPAEEREVVHLLWYEGMTQPEAAAVLGVSTRTVLRRWHAARLRLHGALHDGPS